MGSFLPPVLCGSHWLHLLRTILKYYSWVRASLIAQLVKNPPAMQEPQFDSWVGKIYWRRDRLLTPVFLGFPCGSAGKESSWNAGDLGLIPGLGRSPGEGKGYPLQCSGLENSMDCMAHGVAKSQTQWMTLTLTFHSWAKETGILNDTVSHRSPSFWARWGNPPTCAHIILTAHKPTNTSRYWE